MKKAFKELDGNFKLYLGFVALMLVVFDLSPVWQMILPNWVNFYHQPPALIISMHAVLLFVGVIVYFVMRKKPFKIITVPLNEVRKDNIVILKFGAKRRIYLVDEITGTKARVRYKEGDIVGVVDMNINELQVIAKSPIDFVRTNNIPLQGRPPGVIILYHIIVDWLNDKLGGTDPTFI